jgi:hypothetical protein
MKGMIMVRNDAPQMTLEKNGGTPTNAAHSEVSPQSSSFENRAEMVKRLVERNLIGEAQCNVSACGGKCRGTQG